MVILDLIDIRRTVANDFVFLSDFHFSIS